MCVGGSVSEDIYLGLRTLLDGTGTSKEETSFVPIGSARVKSSPCEFAETEETGRKSIGPSSTTPVPVSAKKILDHVSNFESYLQGKLAESLQDGRNWIELTPESLEDTADKTKRVYEELLYDNDEVLRVGRIRYSRDIKEKCNEAFKAAKSMYVHFYNLNNISKFYKRKITPIYIPSTTYKLALDIFHGAC